MDPTGLAPCDVGDEQKNCEWSQGEDGKDRALDVTDLPPILPPIPPPSEDPAVLAAARALQDDLGRAIAFDEQDSEEIALR